MKNIYTTKKELIYISHPSSGLEENTLDVERIVRELYSDTDLYKEYCFVSPIHCFGFMYDDFEYFKGLSFCTDLLKHCKLMLVFGDWTNSVGCTKEVDLCNEVGIPVLFMGNSNELKSKIDNGLNIKIKELIAKYQ